MTSNPPNQTLARLLPAVAEYATDRFRLADDLDRLERVRGVQAPEAAVLYCARVLDALSADAVTAIKLQPSPNVFSNLDLLQSLNLFPMATRYWAHALRRLGNQVRHIHSRVVPEDQELAILFLERWLEWYFRDFRYGKRLASLTRDASTFALCGDFELDQLVRSLEAGAGGLAAAVRQIELRLNGPLPTAPTLPAVLAELLLDRGDHPAAEALLRAALGRFPDDLRLRQLQGLYFSRMGNLPEALKWLEPLYEQNRDDDETAGIMAGILKRSWLKNSAQRELLESSHRAYRQGWDKSKQVNYYLGINAATTNLWLGHPAESRKTASVVRALLFSQTATLAAFAGDPDLACNFWQHMTLVEAELLLGNFRAARDRYTRTAERFSPTQGSNLAVAGKQFDAILPALGLSCTAAELLSPTPASLPATAAESGARLVIGVTGHRNLPRDGELRAVVIEALQRVIISKPGGKGPPPVALSALAEGADRLVAEILISAPFAGTLRAVLPLEVADYRTDFTAADSWQEFQSLLDRAESIQFPDRRANPTRPQHGHHRSQSPNTSDRDQRNAAYLWAGQYVADHCDVLIALWNGQPAAGPGGTAEIVDYARQTGRPLIWITTTPPYAMRAEGIELSG